MSPEELRLLLAATFRIIDATKRSADPLNTDAEVKFINMFIETLVSRTLNSGVNKTQTKKQQAETLRNSYAKVKLGIQESVALGFQEAMQRFSRQHLEFYCTIRTVMDPKTTTTH